MSKTDRPENGRFTYYLVADGRTVGPYSPEQVRQRLNVKKVVECDFIWRDGFEDWPRIADVLSEIPGEELPPPPDPDQGPTTLEITHPNELPPTRLEIPQKGTYEPPATLSQKNRLMKLGCKDPDTLRRLGRDQASFMIDAFQRDMEGVVAYELEKRAAASWRSERRRNRRIALAILIFLFIAGAFAITTWLMTPR